MLIGFGIPLLQMAVRKSFKIWRIVTLVLSISTDPVIQGHRYDILEGMGCAIATHNVTIAFPLFYAWPPTVSLISAGFGVMAIIHFSRRERQARNFLGSSTDRVRIDHYLRLIWFSAFEICYNLPLTSFILIVGCSHFTVFPFISWEDTHWGFNRADRLLWFWINQDRYSFASVVIHHFSIPFSGFCFFAFFGLSKRQREAYAHVFTATLVKMGIRKKQDGQNLVLFAFPHTDITMIDDAETLGAKGAAHPTDSSIPSSGSTTKHS